MAVDPSAETEAERPGATAGPGGTAGAGAGASAGGGAAKPLAAGDTLGKYRLEHVLGAGGMGVVWAAVDPDLERAVAIKLLRVGDGSETQRTRLLREARAMARLKHPNVLTVYEVGTAAGVDYIAMELVDGENLGTWLAKPQPRTEIVAALLAAGRGLAAAHAAGIVHRDFKPENVLRDRAGHVFVTDFGLAFGQVTGDAELVPLALPPPVPLPSPAQPTPGGAQHTPSAAALGVAATAAFTPNAAGSGSGRRPLDSVLDSPLTQTGVLIGTPAYMAPEQFLGGSVGPRSDQFAYCVTAWEALAGQRPFRGRDLAELRAAGEAGVADLIVNLEARVRIVLARGLAARPELRWPDMPALLHALETALAAPTKKRVPTAMILAASAAAIAIAAGAVVYSTRRGAHHNVGANCDSAEEAFAEAWGPERQSAVRAAHPGMGNIAAFAILDETRNQWVQAYNQTCATPESPERHERLGCLLEVRDEVASTTRELESADADMGVGEIAGLVAAIETCGQHG